MNVSFTRIRRAVVLVIIPTLNDDQETDSVIKCNSIKANNLLANNLANNKNDLPRMGDVSLLLKENAAFEWTPIHHGKLLGIIPFLHVCRRKRNDTKQSAIISSLAKESMFLDLGLSSRWCRLDCSLVTPHPTPPRHGLLDFPAAFCCQHFFREWVGRSNHYYSNRKTVWQVAWHSPTLSSSSSWHIFLVVTMQNATRAGQMDQATGAGLLPPWFIVRPLRQE